jgi:D-arginine dehydrogenase
VKVDIIIIGAGFAGASTAYHLCQNSNLKVVAVDKEEIPGAHASGKNASLVLQSVENPVVRSIVAKSRQAFSQNADQIGYEELGSLQLGSRDALAKLRDPNLIHSELLDTDQARRLVPLLDGHQFESALWTPSDGVMDISKLLYFYLEGARRSGRFELQLNSQVLGIHREGEVCIVETSQGSIECGVIVNAAGAWAPQIATLCGIESLPMKSFKRHLFILEGIGCTDSKLPFVWSIADNFYFRPESGGVLFSVCDEKLEEHQFIPTVEPIIEIQLAELIDQHLPQFEEARQRRVWSCFRTKTPHGGFHIEWSEGFSKFLWVAGLGGHGMGASWEVGRLAARKILELDHMEIWKK